MASEPQTVVTVIWRSFTLVSLVALGFWAGALTARVEGLERWSGGIEIVKDARDERLRTLEQDAKASASWRVDVIRRLERIEQRLP